jgi:hypothetical protein
MKKVEDSEQWSMQLQKPYIEYIQKDRQTQTPGLEARRGKL